MKKLKYQLTMQDQRSFEEQDRFFLHQKLLRDIEIKSHDI